MGIWAILEIVVLTPNIGLSIILKQIHMIVLMTWGRNFLYDLLLQDPRVVVAVLAVVAVPIAQIILLEVVAQVVEVVALLAVKTAVLETALIHVELDVVEDVILLAEEHVLI